MYRSLLPCAFLACALPASAATTGINAFHTDNFLYASNPVLNELGTTLALGSVIQLGYFSGITDVNDPLIWDAFVPLTGDGSNNSAFFDTRIGDGTDDPSPSGAGYWNLSANFDDGIHADIPAGGGRVGVRIFNASTVASATHFNTVTSSDSDWLMAAPNTPGPTNANASIDAAPPLTWQSGGTGTFQTSLTVATTAVPEASEALILLLGLTGILRHRRRR